MKICAALFILLLLVLPAAASARDGEHNSNLDYAQVRGVEAEKTGPDTYTFRVTVEHRDEGWDHYADQWQIVHPDTGEVLATRVLHHPHDNEQPFTRSLSSVELPPGLQRVLVRARCNQHGFEGRQVLAPLPR
jgi:hypothetical protein